MAKDAVLLEQLNDDSPPILHLYEWEGSCLTYGYFTNPARYLHLEVLDSLGLRKARRPTGGGIIFHLTDFAFSLLLPAGHPNFSLNTLENYAFVNQNVAMVVASFTRQGSRPGLFVQDSACTDQECHPFCMAKPTQYDLMIDGKKAGGAAQRRTRKGLLHQASLSLTLPPLDLLAQVLKNEEQVLRAMRKIVIVCSLIGPLMKIFTPPVRNLNNWSSQI